jgi:Double zinc ribbon/SAP domain
VIDGAPVRLWELTCPPCEAYLAKFNPDLWAGVISEIGETPDEEKAREDFQKRGALDRDQIMALAMAKLAGVELPETMRRPISGLAPHVPVISGQLECADGHPNEPGMKFCGDCGMPLRAAPRLCPDGHEVAAKMRFCGECGQPVDALPALEAPLVPAARSAVVKRMKDMRSEDLKRLARDRGLDDSGTRTQLLERLRAA